MADIELSGDIDNIQNINASFTNDLNINLQKEITMGIELNGPLYIGADTTLQEQVAQNTEDISELKTDVSGINGDIGSLSNLTTTDKSSLVGAINEVNTLLPPTSQRDYIDNSKAMPTGAVSTNDLILPEIKAYAHSTFDRSKFTITGSPVITDDGIASGFSSSNYITATVPNFDVTKPFEILSPVFSESTTDGDAHYIFQTWSGGSQGLRLNVLGTNIQIQYKLDGESSYTTVQKGSIITANNKYQVKVIFTGSAYKFQYQDITNNSGWQDIGTEVTSSTKLSGTNTTFNVGGHSSNPYGFQNGSIDLKQFSITVYGVLVFSGNKTGVDTIKPDNYTVVGTPTISADGIASGFTSGNNGNHIVTNQFDSTKPFKIRLNKVKPTNSGNQVVFRISGTTGNLIFFFNNNYGINFYDGGNNYSGAMAAPPQATQDIDIEVISDTTNITVNLYQGSSTPYSTLTKDWAFFTGFTLSSTANIWLGAWEYLNPYTSSIDLNAFKIYVDGDLVFQPCLKIPYTASKTGSKIVDSIYRDRVADMSAQFGYANYYTLSDTDFTLPQVELYGLIGQRTLRDSYRNGINYWELYSNIDLEQGGSCTSGVEVTFARPFADTNYVLSVPYSAKSATAFTPTQTSDWIAKGKGLL